MGPSWLKFAARWRVAWMILAGWLFASPTALARKTDNPIYEDPFDIACGGASLTRSSRNGVIFANPALMPYGGAFHRWLGNQTSIIASPDSARFIDQERGIGAQQSAADIVDLALNTPIHFGFNTMFSWILNNVGIGLFSHMEFDIRGRERADDFLPSIRFRADGYGGVGIGMGFRTVRWLSLGITAKAIAAAEPDISISLTDQEAIAALSDYKGLLRDSGIGLGIGGDLGMLMFFQGKTIDYRFALKIDDVGDTSFRPISLGGDGEDVIRAPFEQTYSVGTSVTLHNAADAIHFSLDYRDITNEYDQPIFRRIHAGTRVVLREFVGFGAGLYDGYPTYGIQIDMVLLKLGASIYTREMGENLGDDKRNMYHVYFAAGF